MTALAAALQDDGDAAPARLRDLLVAELARGITELERRRSGYEAPVVLAFGAREDGALVAALPVPAGFRADPTAIEDRAWRVVAAAIGALQHAVELPPPSGPQDLAVQAGVVHGGAQLALTLGRPGDAELAQLAAEEALQEIDRLRTQVLRLPDGVVVADDCKDPIGPAHTLRIAEAVARMGGDPAAPDEVTEERVSRVLWSKHAHAVARPHEDPEPARRTARRILQRLDGMGKWGGYHTDFAHLARGFQGNERALADAVGEALLDSGLLAEKPSVGQRHVYLNPRQAGAVRRLIDEGELPATLRLPTKW